MKTQICQLLKSKDVTIADSFFDRYRKLVKDVVIPYQQDILEDKIPDTEPSHAVRNFRIAAGEMEGSFYGEIFQDSDLYKWLEAVGNSLRIFPDTTLEQKADEMISLIERAQQKDGYLNTYFIIEAPEKRWTNLLECHELYCAGHLIEAAVSYYEATKKDPILKIACRFADYIDTVFGYANDKVQGCPGHQEIELALLRLYDVTGEERYYSLANYFIDVRGTNSFFEEEYETRNKVCHWTKNPVSEPNRWYNQFPYQYYNQFHAPVREQKEAVGHAVRAVYLYTAMADIASRSGEEALINVCKGLWDSVVKRQMYITGGIGSTHSGEAFTVPYDLPNDTNYSETCASIGLIFFAQKMLTLEADAVYGDVMEKAIYNTVLAGMSADGKKFFYVNPLEVVPDICLGNTERNHVKPIRQKWFACACCPPNIARLLTSLEQYIYTYQENTAYIHLYIGSMATLPLADGTIQIKQEGGYPWDGKISLTLEGIEKEREITFALRIPGWCKQHTITINGETAVGRSEKGYLYLERTWKNGDNIILELEMPAKLMRANSRIHYNGGRAALQRGPVVYCMEETDNGKYLNNISIAENAALTETFEENLLGGCVTVLADAYREEMTAEEEELYTCAETFKKRIKIKAVPYFLWNNRQAGEMQVWVRKN